MRRSPLLRWPLALLVGSLACLTLALVEARRADRSNERVAKSALWGYSNFVLWSYREHLTETLRAMAREALGAVNHGDQLHMSPQIPDAGELGHYLPWDPTCDCHVTRAGPPPLRYLGFRLGTDTLGVGENWEQPGKKGWLADDPENGRMRRRSTTLDAERRWLVDTITAVARSGPSPWGYHLIATGATNSQPAHFLLAALMPTSSGDTMVYAVEYPETALQTVLATVLESPTIVPTALSSKGANRQILSVQVRDARNTALFDWNVPDKWSISNEERMPAGFGSLVLQLELRPELTKDLTIGGLPRSRLPLLIALLILTAGLTVVAMVQMRREFKFDRDRAAFVANVSHELRTPLTQIRLVTDTLRLGRETDPARRDAALEQVDREVTRLQHLADGVLRFSRGERPNERTPVVPVDVAEEIGRAVDEFAPLAQQRGVQISVAREGSPVLHLRPGSLRQIILNLLDNAVKYGPDGQQIAVMTGTHANGDVFLRVADQGPGIQAHETEQIWKAYQRGAAAENSGTGGSGIGLTVVRDIAEAHGGTAQAVSIKGNGATFEVTFPAERK